MFRRVFVSSKALWEAVNRKRAISSGGVSALSAWCVGARRACPPSRLCEVFLRNAAVLIASRHFD